MKPISLLLAVVVALQGCVHLEPYKPLASTTDLKTRQEAYDRFAVQRLKDLPLPLSGALVPALKVQDQSFIATPPSGFSLADYYRNSGCGEAAHLASSHAWLETAGLLAVVCGGGLLMWRNFRDTADATSRRSDPIVWTGLGLGLGGLVTLFVSPQKYFVPSAGAFNAWLRKSLQLEAEAKE
jgi:hypothetical protein